MKKSWLKKGLCFVILLLFLSVSLMTNMTFAGSVDNTIDIKKTENNYTNLEIESDFTIPEWGGAMIHSDQHLSDYIDLPAPTDDVKIVWFKYDLAGEKQGTLGTGQSGNGKIVACTWGSLLPDDNLVVYDYYGNCIWESNNLFNAFAQISAPIVSLENKVIACDDQYIRMIDPYNNDNGECVWSELLPDLFEVPVSPTLTDNGVILLPSLGGPLYAFDLENNGNLLDTWEDGDYTPMNSVCVNENRAYVLVHKFNIMPPSKTRLYAFDINKIENNVFDEAWCYEFDGLCQASPTYIDGTLYFDRYLELAPGDDPYVFAVTDLGDSFSLKWKKSCNHKTLFSLTYDPRGGIWYEDHSGRRLYRYDLDSGEVLENIFLDDLIDEYDSFGNKLEFIPMSPMFICGDPVNPIMLVSANTPELTFPIKRYVIGIKLKKDHNQLLWKVLVDDDEWLNYVGSQFTILMDDNWENPRILCAKYKGGVMAIGSSGLPSPPIIDGNIYCIIGQSYPYMFQSSDPEDNDVYYYIEWGDGTPSKWLGPYESGKTIVIDHKWYKYGSYTIKAKAKDSTGAMSDWTNSPLTVTVSKSRDTSLTFLSLFNTYFKQFSFLQKILRTYTK